jgi:hypothetical protein
MQYTVLSFNKNILYLQLKKIGWASKKSFGPAKKNWASKKKLGQSKKFGPAILKMGHSFENGSVL